MIDKKIEKSNNIKANTLLPPYGIWAESRIRRPEFTDAGHSHSHLSIIYIVSGRGVFEIPPRKFQLLPNTVITLKRQQLHKLLDQPRKAMTVFSLYFDRKKSGLDNDIIDYLFSSNEPFVLPLFYAEQIKRNIRQILREQNATPPGYKLAIRQELALAVLQIYRVRLEQSKQSAPIIGSSSLDRTISVLEFIAANYHQQYSLSNAARMAQLSQRQFSNLCRKITKKSFIQFLNFKRCEKAKQLLKTTNMPVSAIAFEVGFEELSTFYRAFKKYHRIRPLDSRKIDESHLKKYKAEE